MLTFSHRLSAVCLALALAAGQSGVCAGWMPVPDGRMACCAEGPCRMHDSSADHGPTHAPSQAEADRCCAVSGQDDSAPSPSGAAFLITLAAVLSPVPTVVAEHETHADLWRASAPVPAAHVPKHLLLSVFLV